MYSSSTQIILTSSPDGSITAYDAFTGTILTHFSGSRSPRHGLALVGKAFIAATHISSTTASGSIHLYNWWSPTALHHIPVSEPVASLAATPDGSYLFAGSLSGSVYALKIPSGNVIQSSSAHKNSVSCLAITNDSSLLISGGVDGTISVIPIFQLVEDSTNDGSIEPILLSFVAHDGPITAIAPLMGSSHSYAVSCSTDCTCKLWSILNGTNLRTITFPCSISGIALDPTDTEFYAAGSNGLIYSGLLKVSSKKDVCRVRKLATWSEKHVGAIVSVSVINLGLNLVSAAEDGSVCVWNVETRQSIMAFSNKFESISNMVVAGGIGDGRCVGMSSVVNESGIRFARFPGKEIIRSVRDAIEMESVWNEAVKDRGRAIDMLESALEVYERLLELILKEARGSTGNKNEYSK